MNKQPRVSRGVKREIVVFWERRFRAALEKPDVVACAEIMDIVKHLPRERAIRKLSRRRSRAGEAEKRLYETAIAQLENALAPEAADGDRES